MGRWRQRIVNPDPRFTASTNSCDFALAARAEISRALLPNFFFADRSVVLHPSINTLQISRGMSRLEGKVLVAQGGGPTAVINQSIVGVTLEARKFTQVKAVYGAIHGVQGNCQGGLPGSDA